MIPRILVLDNIPATADTVALLVAALGYTAVRGYDAATAIHRIENEPFDLLLAKYDMPGINGLEIVAQLRKRRLAIPVVIMSGDIAVVDRVKADQLKISHVLKTPFTVAELEEILKLNLSSTHRGGKRIILSTDDGYTSKPSLGSNPHNCFLGTPPWHSFRISTYG